MKQRFKCKEPGCPLYVDFSLEIEGSFMIKNRAFDRINIFGDTANVKVDEDEILKRRGKLTFSIISKDKAISFTKKQKKHHTEIADLTCDNGHNYAYNVIIE